MFLCDILSVYKHTVVLATAHRKDGSSSVEQDILNAHALSKHIFTSIMLTRQ